MNRLAWEGEDYSPIFHIASIVSPRLDDCGDVLMVMLTAAFDASGDEARPTLTVAGFVSNARDWDDFSRLWKARLDVEGIKYFRAVEAAHFSREFRPWRDNPNREQWRRKLFVDLMDILKRHVYRKFGATIINRHFGNLSEELKKFYRLRAYGVAGRTCDKQVREWASDERISTPIELVFEEGDDGAGELEKRLLVDTGRRPIFRPKNNTVRKDGGVDFGFVPLQAADWLAYELSNAVEELEADRLKNFRWPLEQFDSIHGEPTTYAESDLERMEGMLALNRKISEWCQGVERMKEERR